MPKWQGGANRIASLRRHYPGQVKGSVFTSQHTAPLATFLY